MAENGMILSALIGTAGAVGSGLIASRVGDTNTQKTLIGTTVGLTIGSLVFMTIEALVGVAASDILISQKRRLGIDEVF